jgi:uncharacterized protein
MGQTWESLLFAHWRVPRTELERVVPSQLPIDSFEGSAWVGVTPFVVRALRLRGTPPIPGLSTFAEVNVRTYVTVDGQPGIHFLSLDAASRFAVFSARRLYRLPYFRSEMSARRARDGVDYRCRRVSSDGPPAELDASYRPSGPVFQAPRGTLEHFLTERYCLYTLDENGRILRGEIHHPPWPIQEAVADVRTNTMTAGHGLALEGDPILHFSARQDVVLWRLAAVG